MRLGVNCYIGGCILVNNYPEWWDQQVTIYNKFEDPDTRQVSWYRTQVNKCFWKYVENKLTLGETELQSTSIICRIPKNDLFRERYVWEQMSAVGRMGYFTISPGDIIIKGAITDVVDEYVSGSRSSDLLKKYKKLQGCMVVEQCAIDTGIGRGNEHYKVVGV